MKRRISLIVTIGLCAGIAHGQTGLYLQTDRDDYCPGDTVWAKGYTSGETGLTLCIELRGMDGKLYTSGLYPRTRYNFECTLVLPDKLPAAFYLLRYYLRKDTVAGRPVLYEKLIAIHQPDNPIGDPVPGYRSVEPVKPLMQVGFSIDTIRSEAEGQSQLSFYLTPVDTVDLSLSIATVRAGDFVLPFSGIIRLLRDSVGGEGLKGANGLKNAPADTSEMSGVLDNVTVRVRHGYKYLDSVYTSNVFSATPDYALDVRNEKYYTNLFQYLRAKLLGFDCRGAGCRDARFRGYVPVFYLDEKVVPVDQLLDIVGDRLDQVAYVKAFVSFVGNGAAGGAGAIVIYRKKAARQEMGAGQVVSNMQAYSPVFRFSATGTNTRTLLWAPDIFVAPEEGVIRLIFRFRNIGEGEKKIARLEGIDRKGRLFFVSREF